MIEAVRAGQGEALMRRYLALWERFKMTDTDMDEDSSVTGTMPPGWHSEAIGLWRDMARHLGVEGCEWGPK